MNGALSDRNRNAISQEVVVFISAVAGQIQEINNMRDELMSEAEDLTVQFEHYKLIKESLLSVSLINFFDILSCCSCCARLQILHRN